jgi:hypothetical protein
MPFSALSFLGNIDGSCDASTPWTIAVNRFILRTSVSVMRFTHLTVTGQQAARKTEQKNAGEGERQTCFFKYAS